MKHPHQPPCILSLIVLLFCIVAQVSYAQQKSSISVIARDKISNRSIKNMHVSVLGADSTLIDTCSNYFIDFPGDPQHISYAEVSTNQPYYLIKLEHKGYKTRMVRVEPEKEIYLSDVKMEREAKVRQLGEASVTASKVMMVMKGDTIVYNADAFELGEGSMLDQLIALLPGVKLEPGGVITVNGNRVNSLLINGKDFFNGDPNIALENLPAYTVDKIKAYQKAPDDAYITRQNDKARANDPWVIDVNLKKDYNTGLLTTAEAGAGTHNRYLGKLFAMRFTDHTQLFVHANVNNLNDVSRAEKDGGWYNYNSAPQGEIKQQKGGISFNLTGKNPRNYFSTTLNGSHVTTDVDNRMSAVNYLTTGDTYGRSHAQSRVNDKAMEWNASARLSLKKVYATWEHTLNYSTSNTHSDAQSATFTTEPYEERTNALLDSLYYLNGYRQPLSIINSVRDQAKGDSKHWYWREKLYFSFALPHNKSIDATIIGAYNHDAQTSFSQYLLHTPQATPTTDYRNRYAQSPQKKYNLYGLLNYSPFEKEKNDWTHSINLAYIINYNHNNTDKTLYRLDGLGNGWEQPNRYALGMLPSTTDSLTQSIDWANTYNTLTTRFEQVLTANYYLSHNGWQILFEMPFKLIRQQADDLRKQVERNKVTKNYPLLNPNLQISGKGMTMHLNIKHDLPDANLLLPVCDDSNPLAVWQGNSGLKAATTYNFDILYCREQTEHALSYEFYYKIQTTRNAIGQTRQYNALTGATLFSPANINGNWNTTFRTNFERALDKKQHWALGLNAYCNYQNSVDFERSYQTTERQFPKSIVHNINTQGAAEVKFKSKPLNATLGTSLDWRKATSHRTDFVTLNSFNVLYKFTMQAKLPLSIELNSDLTLFTRHGYADATLNRSEWIWNASVEKRLLRSKALSVKVKATDLLAQRRNVERTLNAQGYTETWYNTLPRYVLFTLTYRFHKAPKRSYE